MPRGRILEFHNVKIQFKTEEIPSNAGKFFIILCRTNKLYSKMYRISSAAFLLKINLAVPMH